MSELKRKEFKEDFEILKKYQREIETTLSITNPFRKYKYKIKIILRKKIKVIGLKKKV